jgi:hypothetical protein
MLPLIILFCLLYLNYMIVRHALNNWFQNIYFFFSFSFTLIAMVYFVGWLNTAMTRTG